MAPRSKKKKPSTALAAPSAPMASVVRDGEFTASRPDVIANGMMGRVQEMVAMGAHMAADVAQGKVTPQALMQFTASINQNAMILAHQGLALQAEAKRLQDIREEERRIVLLANKSGEAIKLLRMLLSTFGSEWRFHRHNDETGVTSSVPMGKLIGSLLKHDETVLPQHDAVAPLTEAQHQAATMHTRLAAAGGKLVEK